MTSSLEVRDKSLRDWEDVILQSYTAWRPLVENRGGVIVGDALCRTLRYEPIERTKLTLHAARFCGRSIFSFCRGVLADSRAMAGATRLRNSEATNTSETLKDSLIVVSPGGDNTIGSGLRHGYPVIVVGANWVVDFSQPRRIGRPVRKQVD